jgi:hypothetical protein
VHKALFGRKASEHERATQLRQLNEALSKRVAEYVEKAEPAEKPTPAEKPE